MADLTQFFDDKFVPDNEDLSTEFELLPDDVYVLEVVRADLVVPNSGDGFQIKMEHVVVDGKFKGRRLWKYFVIGSADSRKAGMAKRALAQLAQAAGFRGELEDTDQMLGLLVKAKVTKSTGDFRGNNVGSYLPISESGSPSPHQKQLVDGKGPEGGSSAAPGQDVPPWSRAGVTKPF